MMPRSAVIVGASETSQLGKIEDMSELGMHAQSALLALQDAGLKPSDIDGIAAISEYAAEIAFCLGITPRWIDSTNVGGCSFMLMVRHAAAAIEAGLCNTVLITHGESGRSQIGARPWPAYTHSLHGQFEMPYGALDPIIQCNLPLLHYMEKYAVTREALAYVPVVQREWAALNSRAHARTPLTVDQVLDARMIVWPLTRLMCCLVTDGGGALVLTSRERARDLTDFPVYLLGSGEGVETIFASQTEKLAEGKASRISAEQAFRSAGLGHKDIDHLMLYDPFAQFPLWGLEALGFVKAGEAAAFYADGHTRPGGKLPVNTNGGGLSYTHTGMYGMFAIQESVRQLRGQADAQIPGIRTSLCHGVGNVFEAGGTLVLGNAV
ncbi:thiolase C-terminal domain-containing protein [Bradyrhizobium sp. AUGA SZCCT0431]|uniref:thiolase C-terminal domain-containing protein n=1 Tax=Bradyrhizobium sp. AUGA SZCCT0431 TaxID=2807674 RepID=UPI001BA96F36|nr:thiolase [Bradyrhizobium sp. AUGA SZCCT0431]MBR1146187.1 thiolase [Bradyrhizobium sp. AUGA SZCCT0431]